MLSAELYEIIRVCESDTAQILASNLTDLGEERACPIPGAETARLDMSGRRDGTGGNSHTRNASAVVVPYVFQGPRIFRPCMTTPWRGSRFEALAPR